MRKKLNLQLLLFVMNSTIKWVRFGALSTMLLSLLAQMMEKQMLITSDFPSYSPWGILARMNGQQVHYLAHIYPCILADSMTIPIIHTFGDPHRRINSFKVRFLLLLSNA